MGFPRKKSARSGNDPEATVSRQEILRKFREKKFDPVYLLYGPENFLVRETVHALIESMLDPAERSMNLDTFDGSDVDPKQIISAALSFPMMGERRLVVVWEYEKLDKDKRDILIPYVAKPCSSSTVVFVSENPDFRVGLSKALKEHAVVLKFESPDAREAAAWIVERAKRSGKSITPDAAELLLFIVGSSLRDLANEIEKLVTFISDTPVIRPEDVSAVIGRSRTYNVFELQKAIGQKQESRAVEILLHLLEAGESPIAMVYLLTKYFQKLWLLHDIPAGMTPAAYAQSIQIYRSYLDEYLSAAARFSDAELSAWISSLLVADESLKSSVDPNTVMMTLVSSCLARPDSVVSALR